MNDGEDLVQKTAFILRSLDELSSKFPITALERQETERQQARIQQTWQTLMHERRREHRDGLS